MSGAGEPLVVLVTGASSGIGRACALLAAERGHCLVLVARRAEVLAEVADLCSELGTGTTLVVAADVAEDEQVADAVAQTMAAHGRIDVVLHCAGVVAYGRTEDVSAEDFARVVNINLLGTAAVARHVVPILREQGTGDLVVIGSLLGHIAVPEMTAYVASKWGVRALVRQLRIENVDLPGVRISHVAPGSVDTPIYSHALDDAGNTNRPPPPSITPERAAKVILAQIGSRRSQRQTALSNYLLIAAFHAAPQAWDRLVGPAFRAVSRVAAH